MHSGKLKDDDVVCDADIKRHIQTQVAMFSVVAPVHQIQAVCMS